MKQVLSVVADIAAPQVGCSALMSTPWRVFTGEHRHGTRDRADLPGADQYSCSVASVYEGQSPPVRRPGRWVTPGSSR
jgi:hypothetical protein